jgi:hypothetical protein
MKSVVPIIWLAEKYGYDDKSRTFVDAVQPRFKVVTLVTLSSCDVA